MDIKPPCLADNRSVVFEVRDYAYIRADIIIAMCSLWRKNELKSDLKALMQLQIASGKQFRSRKSFSGLWKLRINLQHNPPVRPGFSSRVVLKLEGTTSDEQGTKVAKGNNYQLESVVGEFDLLDYRPKRQTKRWHQVILPYIVDI